MELFDYRFDQNNYKESLGLFDTIQDELTEVMGEKISKFEQGLKRVYITPNEDCHNALWIDFFFNDQEFAIEFRDKFHKTEKESGLVAEILFLKKNNYTTPSPDVRIYNEPKEWKVIARDFYLDKKGDFFTKDTETKVSDIDVFKQILGLVVMNCYDE